MGNDHSSEINELERNAREMRREARDREEAFDEWTREQTEAKEEKEREDRARRERKREDRAREERHREAREERQREDRAQEERQKEARHNRELEELANQLKQMEIDRKKKEYEQARAEDERIKKQKEEERIRKQKEEERIKKQKEEERIRKQKEEERIRKQKEEEIRIREEKKKRENEEEQRKKEERIRKENEEEQRKKEEKIRKEKENKIRIREEKERQERLKAEKEKKRMQNILELRAEIKKIKPGESFEFPDEDIIFPKRLNIGLYGATGIGKTSLMNSLKFAVNGQLKETHREQAAPDDFEGGHTTRRMAVRVTPYLTFVDNRGIGAEDIVKDNAADELIIQLEGKRSFASEVVWGKSSRTDDLEVDETKKIYCTVLVFSAGSVTAVHTIIGKFVERLLKWQGRFPLAVITHVDDATPEQLDNMRLALRMAGIVDVYEVANITNEKKDLEPVYQENLLKLLHKCVKDGDRIFELRHEIELEEKKKENRKNKLAD